MGEDHLAEVIDVFDEMNVAAVDDLLGGGYEDASDVVGVEANEDAVDRALGELAFAMLFIDVSVGVRNDS